MIRKVASVYVLAHSGFVIRCCPMADSLLILELLFLHRRGGCSLTVLIFFLMLVGACCFILSASLFVVRPTHRNSVVLPTKLHIGTKILNQHNVFEW